MPAELIAGVLKDRLDALTAREANLPERATLLRAMASLSGAALDYRVGAAADVLKTAALTRTGAERARTMSELALLYSEAGLRARAGELTQLALSTPKLAEPEGTQLHAELLVRSDMASARMLHSVGMYADAEAVLRRLGGLLL